MITPDHETSSQHPHDDCQHRAVLTLCQQSPFRNGRSGPTSLRRSALEISLSAGRDAFGGSGREAGWPEPNFGPDFGGEFGFKKKIGSKIWSVGVRYALAWFVEGVRDAP